MRLGKIMKVLMVIIFSAGMFFVGCSKSDLKNIDLKSLKEETIKKQEDFKKIQEKIKKVKKKN